MPGPVDLFKKLTGKKRWTVRSELIVGYFQPSAKGKFTGTIVLAGNYDLFDTIPHEVFHAVMHAKQTVHANDDESAATAIGILSSRIHRKILKLVDT